MQATFCPSASLVCLFFVISGVLLLPGYVQLSTPLDFCPWAALSSCSFCHRAGSEAFPATAHPALPRVNYSFHPSGHFYNVASVFQCQFRGGSTGHCCFLNAFTYCLSLFLLGSSKVHVWIQDYCFIFRGCLPFVNPGT